MDISASGDNAASPTATGDSETTAAAPTTTKEAMHTRFAELESVEPAPKGAKSSKAASVGGKDADKTKTEPDAPGKKGQKAEKEGDGDDDRSRSYQKRIDELTARRRAAEDKVATKDLEIGKTRKALELLSQETERLRRALQEGKKFDPRDDEITHLRLSENARAAAQQLEAAHQRQIAEAVQREQFSQLRDQLAVELDDALAAHPLLHRSEVIHAAKADPSRTLAEVAAEIEARKLEIARSRFGVAAPQQPRSLPTTINPRPGGHVRKQHPPTKAGMQARYDELIAGGR